MRHHGLDELQDAIGGMDVPRSQLGPLEIYSDGPVKIRPDYLFLSFTTIEHLGAPDLPDIYNYLIIYQIERYNPG